MRVALAASFFARPHLLILDEPSNHLDLEGVESLVAALQQYAGAVLLVSHDQVGAGCWVLVGGEAGSGEVWRLAQLCHGMHCHVPWNF